MTYGSSARSEPTTTQIFSYSAFDVYGNSWHQTIKTYDGAASDGNFAGIRTIDNVYDDPIAQKRGNATSTTSISY